MAADLLVSTDWLARHLSDPNVRVVDMRGSVVTTQVAPGVEQADYLGARDEYLAGHIPGAVYVDWTKDIIDPDDPVPVQIAPPERFAAAMAERGVGDDTLVIAVDHSGGQFATRLWWALGHYGHDQVRVLDGGWNKWVKEGRPVEPDEVAVARAVFTPRTRPGLRVTAEQLAGLLDHPDLDWQLVDARDAGQYSAAKRRGPRGGHIPGALHVPRELFFAPREDFSQLTSSASESMITGYAPTDQRWPIATVASRPRSFFSTWRGWASPIWRTTMVPGTNGAAGLICPWHPDQPRVWTRLVVAIDLGDSLLEDTLDPRQ